MSQKDVTSWLPNLLGPTDFEVNNIPQTVPKRSTVNFLGPVSVSDNSTNDSTDVSFTPLGNVTVSGTPTTGQVLTATSGTAADWQTPSGGGGSSPTGTGIATTTSGTFDATATGYGDLSKVAGSIVVAALSSAAAIAVATALTFGTNPASAGAIRLANATAIKARNAANTADAQLLNFTGGNLAVYGDSSFGTVVQASAAGGFGVSIAGNTAVALNQSGADFLKLGPPTATGSAYASAGYIRFGDVNASATTLMACRNSTNTADISILYTDGFGQLIFGTSGTFLEIIPSASAVSLSCSAGNFSVNGGSNALVCYVIPAFKTQAVSGQYTFDGDSSLTGWDFKANGGTYSAPLFSLAIAQGTVNSQVGTQRRYTGYLRTTTTTATTAVTIPVSTSGSVCSVIVRATARDVTSGTVGDGFSKTVQIQVKNVAGTVTSASGTSSVTIATTNDTSMATCAVSFNISGTNLLVTVAGLLGPAIDWIVSAEAIYS